MMRAIMLRETGPPDVLKLEEVPVPEIGPAEVLVRVGAVGVAYHDIVQRNGTMRRFTKLPIVLGYEIAGTVESVGALVRTLAPGDRIATKAFRSCGQCRLCRNGMETACLEREHIHGGYAEFAALPEEVCVKLPAEMPMSTACMLGAATGVALNAVRDVGRVRIGERVLVTGASGGVGLAAVELARAAGAVPLALTRSEAKRTALLAAGAAHVIIAPEGADFSAEVRSLTADHGIDAVIDTVGSRVFQAAFKTLAAGGRYVMVGQLFREEIAINPALIFFKRAQILGVGSVRRDQLEDAVALVAAGRLHPKIARVFPLEAAVEAHALVERGEAIGRVVLQP
jgi:NADPH:quinone reductase-like Zn-dependent oxidoreductase